MLGGAFSRVLVKGFLEVIFKLDQRPDKGSPCL